MTCKLFISSLCDWATTVQTGSKTYNRLLTGLPETLKNHTSWNHIFQDLFQGKHPSSCSWNNLAVLITTVIPGYSHLTQSCMFSRHFTSMHRLLDLTIICLVVSGLTTVKGSSIKLWSVGFWFFGWLVFYSKFTIITCACFSSTMELCPSAKKIWSEKFCWFQQPLHVFCRFCSVNK